MENKEKIGRMNSRITIQQRTLVENTYGEKTEQWTTLATCWAKADFPVSSSDEKINDGLQTGHLKVVFTIRYRTGITEVNRIVFNSENYDIQFVQNTARNNYLVITAIRRA